MEVSELGAVDLHSQVKVPSPASFLCHLQHFGADARSLGVGERVGEKLALVRPNFRLHPLHPLGPIIYSGAKLPNDSLAKADVTSHDAQVS